MEYQCHVHAMHGPSWVDSLLSVVAALSGQPGKQLESSNPDEWIKWKKGYPTLLYFKEGVSTREGYYEVTIVTTIRQSELLKTIFRI